MRSLANPYLFNRGCSFCLRFDKIKEFETAFRSGSTADERFKRFHLKNRIETSGFKYFRQISCKTGYFPCISCECRDISKAIHQAQEFAFSNDADYWWPLWSRQLFERNKSIIIRCIFFSKVPQYPLHSLSLSVAWRRIIWGWKKEFTKIFFMSVSALNNNKRRSSFISLQRKQHFIGCTSNCVW